MNVTQPPTWQRRIAGWAMLSLLLACAGSSAYPIPEGTAILRNGDFSASTDKPIHWVTRSTADLGTFDLIQPRGLQRSAILKVTVERADKQPWMLELRQKLSGTLKKGQTLFLGFEYRISEGYAFHCYWQKDSAPWPKYLALRVDDPVENWDVCMVTVPVPEDLASNQTSLSFHLAEEPGVLQMRNLTAVVVDGDVNVADIETTVEPVVGGDYYDQDWRRKVLARIQTLRKTDMAVSVVDDEKPVPGAQVSVKQTGRPFSVGIEASAALLTEDSLLDDRHFAGLKRRIGKDIDHLPKIRAKLSDPSLFDTLTLSDAFTWREYDYWGKAVLPDLLPRIRNGGQKVRAHAVFIPTFRFAPPKCRLMQSEDLLEAVTRHITSMTETYADQVDQWTVLHGMLEYSEIYDIIGVDILVDAFKITRQNIPDAPLLVSDTESLLLPTDSRVKELIEFIGWLRSQGLDVDGVILGAALSRPYMAPQSMEDRLDLIHGSDLNLPVYIGSLKLEADKETMQAAMLQDLMTLFFSHPAVHGVSLACPWEASALNRRCALYRTNGAPCKSGSMIEQLLTEEWLTTLEGKTNDTGVFQGRAFHGTYTVTAAVNGREVSVQAEISPETPSVVVDLTGVQPKPDPAE